MANENVFLFIPNIIGYIRILLTITSCYWMFTDPLKSAFCFCISHTVLDDLDGIAARRFNQATLFGGVFDLVIDRCSFMVWLMGLCVLYPQYALLFQLYALLDIMRMWMKLYSSSLTSKRNVKQSHGNWILEIYYSELGLHIVAYGSEIYFVMLQLCYFSPGPGVFVLGYGLWQICAAALFPLVIIKVPINLLILKIGCQEIAAVDVAKRSQQK